MPVINALICAIISRYAFPKGVPRSDYRELIGDRLHRLTVPKQRRSETIYAACYVPNTRSQFTVVYSHANGETLQMIHYLLEQYAQELNVNIVAYDFEGYGQSSGKASEANLKNK